MNKKINLTILNPGGNITALINGIPAGRWRRRQINDAVMKNFQNVEQVGFFDPAAVRLEMAGGEFCGNATRCAAYLTLKGKPGKTDISVSGTKQILRSRIDKRGMVWAQMPILKNRDCVRETGDCLHCGPRGNHPSNYL
jgi:diaminopimelate epimerase